MLEILKDLHEDDHFALIQFDHIVLMWKASLTQATKENVILGMDYVQTIQSSGCK